jgi:hypothetical protein
MEAIILIGSLVAFAAFFFSPFDLRTEEEKD